MNTINLKYFYPHNFQKIIDFINNFFRNVDQNIDWYDVIDNTIITLSDDDDEIINAIMGVIVLQMRYPEDAPFKVLNLINIEDNIVHVNAGCKADKDKDKVKNFLTTFFNNEFKFKVNEYIS